MNKALFFLLILPLQAISQVNFQSSDLPIVLISTNNGEPIPDEPKISAQMKIIDNGPGHINHLSDPPNHYDGFIGIERRGSTSQDLSDKKPYAVETRNDAGEDLPVSLLGMPKESDWVFIAPFNDKSLVRDALALELARRTMTWASRSRFVELVLNGDYQGVYLVVEKIKRDKNRVDISKLSATDLAGDSLTGGYILKLDKTTGAAADGWVSTYPPIAGSWQSTNYQYHYPKPEDIQPQQKQYIHAWITDFEDAMHSPQYADTTNGYAKYIDIQSFIDYIIVNEMTKNVDAYRLSTFLYKDRDDKNPHLFAGPVWDFNIAFGNADYCSGNDYQGWAINFNGVCNQDNWVVHFWWLKLWNDTAFRERLAARWKELRADLFSDPEVTGMLDSLVGVVQESQARNFQRWPILNQYVWPNPFCCGSYGQHVDYLRTWTLNRLHWMDGAMNTFSLGVYENSKYFPTEVFPNPSGDHLTFKYYVRYTDEILIRIFDAAGRHVEDVKTVQKVNGENRHTWFHSLKGGVYFYSVFINSRKESSGKFVVERR